ncbi:MAG TPA: DUF192 domain-containing protein [Verrucomicrobiae bacterium]|nr:DUF192 domain-containing protein [Verrucomicrobiae bacterium]
MRLWRTFLLTGTLAVLTACDKPVAPPTNAAQTTQAPPDESKAQPKLPTIKLFVGAQELVTEIAKTEAQQAAGMMYRTNMAENEAMLFPLPAPTKASFWMRHTLLPLSCAYIEPDGMIEEIRDMKPLDETPIVAASDKILYVLETRQGWFERNHVTTGMRVNTERGSLAHTFHGRGN